MNSCVPDTFATRPYAMKMLRHFWSLVLLVPLVSGCGEHASTTPLSKRNDPGDTDTVHSTWIHLRHRLPIVKLPFEYKGWSTTRTDLITLDSKEQQLINGDANGTAVGILPDTSRFIHILWMAAADDILPMVSTFSKDGTKISEVQLITGLCGPDEPCYHCSVTMTISKALTIVSTDTMHMCECDSVFKPIAHTSKDYVLHLEGHFGPDGRLVMNDTTRTTLPSE